MHRKEQHKLCIEKNKLMRILLTETFENVLNNIAPDISAYEGQFTVELYAKIRDVDKFNAEYTQTLGEILEFDSNLKHIDITCQKDDIADTDFEITPVRNLTDVLMSAHKERKVPVEKQKITTGKQQAKLFLLLVIA